MRFDELDSKMRAYETVQDVCALPGVYLAARLDGRRFTRLTKELLDLQRPFDARFRDAMLQATEHLMQSGIPVTYAYTESDEISLLIPPDADAFQRKLRKIVSILAAEASACFSLAIGRAAAFDCRVIQLPSLAVVFDYFRWRQEDAARNALSAHCYWTLRGAGETARRATAQLERASVSDKNELLFARGVNFAETPAWQRRGVALYWQSYAKSGTDPRTGREIQAMRRRLVTDLELPSGDAYRDFLAARIIEERP
jgi:tRNA(His) 5'-end guanylyltransferase